ncbi:serine/threonine protein kinase [Actinokineospora sp. PR83]|uniref:serine/threonine-protein kinase n=1 Tax=Actinokineospora sp. PR83 TaxID=2884908 RepID=UPI0027DF2796|nr:serine/threonine-protein kinase [Actinokineospora sp. PR83]MCG8914492.1 serine/threonine protein kinase [Actinokineospora sp. PR83]
MDDDRAIAGRYRLDEQVGAGGMGDVWRGLDLELGRVVALKRSRVGDDGQFRREARIAAGLHHPRVVTVFDVVVDGDERWLVMEYLPSRSLGRVLDDDGPLSPGAAARVGAQVADALAGMHERSMVHRDVTPGNILVADDGTAKLTDFGIARWAEVTRTGDALVAGTPGYLPPEVAAGREAGPAADVFALGATLFAAVEGHSPWGGDEVEPAARFQRAVAGEVSPSEAAGELGPVLASMLAKDPADRPSARTAKSMLAEVAGVHLASAPVTVAGRTSRRSRRWVLAGAAVALVAVTVATTLVVADRMPPGESAAALPEYGTMGDHRTADPCALLIEDTVSPYGKVFPDTEYGNFNRCGYWIKPEPIGEEIVSAAVELLGPDDGAGPTGEFGVKAWPPAVEGLCSRYLDLFDAHRVLVTARSGTTDPKTLCAIADSLLTGAMSVAARGQVPRRSRPLAPNSLSERTACEMAQEADVVKAAGPGLVSSPGFGGWACFYDAADRDVEISVDFAREQESQFARDDRRQDRFSGRRAVWATTLSGDDGQDTCLIKLEYRPYFKDTEEGDDWVEVIYFDVELDSGATAEQRCAVAESLARSVAARNPSG